MIFSQNKFVTTSFLKSLACCAFVLAMGFIFAGCGGKKDQNSAPVKEASAPPERQENESDTNKQAEPEAPAQNTLTQAELEKHPTLMFYKSAGTKIEYQGGFGLMSGKPAEITNALETLEKLKGYYLSKGVWPARVNFSRIEDFSESESTISLTRPVPDNIRVQETLVDRYLITRELRKNRVEVVFNHPDRAVKTYEIFLETLKNVQTLSQNFPDVSAFTISAEGSSIGVLHQGITAKVHYKANDEELSKITKALRHRVPIFKKFLAMAPNIAINRTYRMSADDLNIPSETSETLDLLDVMAERIMAVINAPSAFPSRLVGIDIDSSSNATLPEVSWSSWSSGKDLNLNIRVDARKADLEEGLRQLAMMRDIRLYTGAFPSISGYNSMWTVKKSIDLLWNFREKLHKAFYHFDYLYLSDIAPGNSPEIIYALGVPSSL